MEDDMIARLRDQALLAQIALIGRIQDSATRLRDRLDRARREEDGQTPTEYLMIVGLMAVVIITVFVVFYWKQVKSSAQTWVNNVKQAVTGKPIQ
jgi:Flp pilus assembly pilin Flp